MSGIAWAAATACDCVQLQNSAKARHYKRFVQFHVVARIGKESAFTLVGHFDELHVGAQLQQHAGSCGMLPTPTVANVMLPAALRAAATSSATFL